MLSSTVKYSLAVSNRPLRVYTPHAKSLASVATLIDKPFNEGRISVSNRSLGKCC